ncbi:uncharacterized protein LOC123006624 [Tribolium madens]|uniref:uncharacterized protein LOC123006624 n=1 Tax=Tribolium madens TaxID=41895 RepID=UPI001CF74AE5|nr:uncharacterized protein LOC123006624 [Tribolium madens]
MQRKVRKPPRFPAPRPASTGSTFYSTVLKQGRRRRGNYLPRGDYLTPKFTPLRIRYEKRDLLNLGPHLQRTFMQSARIPDIVTEEYVCENISTVQRIFFPQNYYHPLQICPFCGFVGYNFPAGPSQIVPDYTQLFIETFGEYAFEPVYENVQVQNNIVYYYYMQPYGPYGPYQFYY